MINQCAWLHINKIRNIILKKKIYIYIYISLVIFISHLKFDTLIYKIMVCLDRTYFAKIEN